MARLCPMSRGRRTVPRSHKGTPKRRQNTPKTASSAATRRSHHRASSRPPATAWPSTAAITGLVRVIRVGPIGPGPWSGIGRRSPVGHRLEVGPGAEGATGAGQHGHTGRLVGLEGLEGLPQGHGRRRVDGVAHLGPVDGHDGDRTVALGVDRAGAVGSVRGIGRGHDHRVSHAGLPGQRGGPRKVGPPTGTNRGRPR